MYKYIDIHQKNKLAMIKFVTVVNCRCMHCKLLGVERANLVIVAWRYRLQPVVVTWW